MERDGGADGPRKRRRISPPETEPYVLQQLMGDVPVAAPDAEDEAAHITCVESWNDNLYVGTSAGEILHFVSLPGEAPNDAAAEPSFILASRLPIASTQNTTSPGDSTGIRQILVLPSANKACILCNGLVTFYSLPELSPTYGTTKVGNCNWIGGIDLNGVNDDGDTGQDPTIMVAVQNKIMLVRIGDEPRLVRNIEYPGCLNSSRRDTIACVADAYSYSLLEVEQRQKIPLFPISSEASGSTLGSGHVEDMPARAATPSLERPDVANGNHMRTDSRGHKRNTSLNAILGSGREASQSPDRRPRTPDPAADREVSAQPAASPDHHASEPAKTRPETPTQDSSKSQSPTQKPLPATPKPASRLSPHIVSPSPSEFLLVTGTEETEPGVGVFVNLDGEVAVRGTLSFQRYPKAVVVDSGNGESQAHPSMNDEQGGHVLAIIEAGEDNKRFIETQRWDIDPGEGERPKSEIPIVTNNTPVGLSRTIGGTQTDFADVARLMQMVRLKSSILDSPAPTPPERSTDPRTRASIEQFQNERELFDGQETDSETSRRAPSARSRRDWEAERNREEQKFASGLGKVKSNIVLWSGNQIWRVVRNPWALQLESVLQVAQSKPTTSNGDHHTMDRDVLSDLVHGLDNVTPKTETEFLGLRYVKQKASLLLFADLISSETNRQPPEAIKVTEEALIAGELDPRVILLFVPLIRGDIVQGSQGIWLYGGIAEVVGSYLGPSGCGFKFSDGVLQLLVRYLMSWQKKRGYGSVTDDTYVFNSVDAALLHLLLEFDAQRSVEQRGSSRTELNKLVDNWKGDFGKGVQLLESYQRLYVLSRLYQSRKMAKDVLGTWKRIIEGEKDTGGELSIDGAELQVRKYLVKLRDMQLVEGYGSWLAARNPKLGIQAFADDSSRTKLDPSHVVSLLKARASNAVQYYLEHLVFTKNHFQYADDLIGYYLDTVISVLESSPQARSVLAESYSTYRALRPPKPSYLNFITENGPPDSWWQSRLRLLQLLGGGGPRSQYTSAAAPNDLSYSIPTVLKRIEPFQNELVSESIILGGRQGRHREALHLLTHGLGDYDTAIRYCIFGGPSSTTSATPPAPVASSAESAESLRETQRTLFKHLLLEFLKISETDDRMERTSDLLARFAPLFDVGEVLALVPDEWSVDILSPFLVRVLRDLVSESREAKVQRALSAGLNLRVGAEYLGEAEKVGGWLEDVEGIKGLKGRGEDGI